MQKGSIEKSNPDITYNFLIGGDGAVYEGVGWNKEGSFAGKLTYE